jgi:hypothetical protein
VPATPRVPPPEDCSYSAFRVPARAEGLQPELTVRNGHPAAPGGAHADARYDARWRAGAGTLAWVRVVITEIGWDGSIRRRAVGTGSLVRGFAANRLTGCPVKLDRTRYVAISATPRAAGGGGDGVPASIAATAPGFTARPASGGTLVTAVSCGARLASQAAGGWFRWPHIDRLSLPGGLRSGADQVRRAGDGGGNGRSASPRRRPAAGWLARRSRRRPAASGPGSARPRR